MKRRIVVWFANKENDPGCPESFSFCRGAGNRTRATRSQTAYTTTMLHPVIFVVTNLVVKICEQDNTITLKKMRVTALFSILCFI